MMFSNFIDQQLLIKELKLFKDSYIINDIGTIFNYKFGSMMYDWIIEMNDDTSYEPKTIEFHISEEDKKPLWKESNKGTTIKLWDKEREELLKEATDEYKELHLQIRKLVIIQIYKTKLVEHLLNKLADNGQFIEVDSKINLV